MYMAVQPLERNESRHIIEHPEERGLEGGSRKWSIILRAIVSQTSTGTVSRATVRNILKSVMERVSAEILPSSGPEQN